MAGQVRLEVGAADGEAAAPAGGRQGARLHPRPDRLGGDPGELRGLVGREHVPDDPAGELGAELGHLSAKRLEVLLGQNAGGHYPSPFRFPVPPTQYGHPPRRA
jgi:hypothetical protein